MHVSQERGQCVFLNEFCLRDRIELPAAKRCNDRTKAHQPGDCLKVARLANEAKTFQEVARRFLNVRSRWFVLRIRFLPPYDLDENAAYEQQDRGEDQCSVGTKSERDPPRKKTGGDAADNSPAAEKTEKPLGFARGPDEIRQRPDLSPCQDSTDANPDVEHRCEPGPIPKM